MAQEYTITRVSQGPPREYTGDYGTTYYVKCMLQGHERPVEIGKKEKNSLKVGDTVFGDIIPSVLNEMGEPKFPTDSFKPSKKPFSGDYKGKPKDEAAIKAMWAIGQSVTFHTSVTSDTTASVTDIESTAKSFYAMVDRVKNTGTQSEGQAVQAAPQASNEEKSHSKRDWTSIGKPKTPEPTEPDNSEQWASLANSLDQGTPIDLNEIPF